MQYLDAERLDKSKPRHGWRNDKETGHKQEPEQLLKACFHYVSLAIMFISSFMCA